MLFEGTIFALNVPVLLVFIALFFFAILTSRALKKQRGLPTGVESWEDKWWRFPIFIGLGLSLVLVLFLFADVL